MASEVEHLSYEQSPELKSQDHKKMLTKAFLVICFTAACACVQWYI
jgi:hypothetical protein